MPIYQDDLPPGASAFSAGVAARAGAQAAPTVAAARATGLPTAALFQPAAPIARPAVAPAVILPPSLLERALDIGARAKSGLQTMLGIAGAEQAKNPARPITTVSGHEKALDELEKRSSPNLFQMRQKASTTPRKQY